MRNVNGERMLIYRVEKQHSGGFVDQSGFRNDVASWQEE